MVRRPDLFQNIGRSYQSCTSKPQNLGAYPSGGGLNILPVFDEEGLVAWVKLWFQDVKISGLSNSLTVIAELTSSGHRKRQGHLLTLPSFLKNK